MSERGVRTTVVATGTIGPPGPRGIEGPQGPPGEGVMGPRGVGQAVFGMDGNIVERVGGARWVIIEQQIIMGVIISVGIAPTGADIIVDVNKNGVTVFTTQANRPTIVVGEFNSELEIPDITELVDGDYLTVDVDQVGSTISGSDLTVQVLLQ